jgi:large subunit ribosomal protein L30
MAASQPPIRHLVVTLRRGLAGVRETHRGVVAALGLRRVGATKRLPNTPSVRGAVNTVRHLLRVTTDEAAAAERAAAKARAAPRPPLEFKH